MRGGEAVARLATLACLAASLAACSFDLPGFGGAAAPEDATGSIAKRDPIRFAADMTVEDLRRARGALALALDPQGNGHGVKWDNPDSRAKGEITPSGSPYVEAEVICRRFTAVTTLASGVVSTSLGDACRQSADEWEIRVLRPS